MTPNELQSLADSLATAKEYADAIVKPSLEQLGGLFADTVGLWRLRNRVRVLLKAKAYCEQRGVKTEALLPQVFVPLIDEAGNTDDPDLSEMFARLLASHMDPASNKLSHPAFAKVLGQLSSLDAKVLRELDEIGAKGFNYDKGNLRMGTLELAELIAEKISSEIGGQEIALCISNVERLGLVDNKPLQGWHLAVFGHRLLSACSEPGTYWVDRKNEEAESLAKDVCTIHGA
jgi:hypothetical protein